MLTTNKQMMPATTVLNANINGPAMQLENAVGYAIQLVITGTPTGTFKLQGSCDPVPNPSLTFGASGAVTYTPTNWTDLGISDAVSAAGSILWNESDLVAYNYVRVVYTDGSSGASTAVLTVSTFNGKGV